MDENQRKIAFVTSLGKKYSGLVDIPNPNFRTTDLLNSSNIYWKNPNEKCYDNALMMYDVTLYLINESKESSTFPIISSASAISTLNH
jgi:hypothetical protein